MINQSIEEYTASVLAWREAREERLRDPHGWLTTAGLFWLEPGENRMGSGDSNPIKLLPGSAPDFAAQFHFQLTPLGEEIKMIAAPGSRIYLEGKPVENVLLEFKDNSSGLISLNDLHIYVIKRGKRVGVRIFDPTNPAVQSFCGLSWYPIDPDFRVIARFTPFEKQRSIQVLDVLGDFNEMPFPGLVEFELQEKVLRLEPVKREDGGLWFMFRDLTSGNMTYSTGRYLNTGPPEDGCVVLDFNLAYNPPCVFTPFATCPLPPLANRLPIEICAGEMICNNK